MLGLLIFSLIALLFYIIPFGIFFMKVINKWIRRFFLFIPISATIAIIYVQMFDSINSYILDKKFPETNNIILKDSTNAVRDSIIVLQKLMEKLPKSKLGNKFVHYEISKYPGKMNIFELNKKPIGPLNDLKTGIISRNLKTNVSTNSKRSYRIQNDNMPLSKLSNSQVSRFIKLISYLDSNKLNGALLINNSIEVRYNDSLRISNATKYRAIIIDTSNIDKNRHEIIDKKSGLYLIGNKR